MTLTIGIIAKEEIILASDSRMSSGFSKNDFVEKIFELGPNAAVGIAGDGMLAHHVFDVIKREKRLNLQTGIQDLAEQLRTELSSAFDKYYPNIELKRRDTLEVLLVGFSFEKPETPHIYHLSSEDNFIPRQSPAGHNSIGTSHISEYILNRIYDPGKISDEMAVMLSIFCIRETSDQSVGVGGIIKVGTMSNKKAFTLIAKPKVGFYYKRCESMQFAHKNKFYPEEGKPI